MSGRERGVTRPGEPARMPAAGRICGDQAGPDWCEAPVFSRGLCRPHYRRAARGVPLVAPEERPPGTPSGHGRYGVVERDGDRLVCHDCGRAYVSLAVHIGMTHGPVREYKLRHGLLLSAPLIATGLQERLREAATGREQLLVGRRSPSTLRPHDPATVRGQRLRHGESRA